MAPLFPIRGNDEDKLLQKLDTLLKVELKEVESHEYMEQQTVYARCLVKRNKICLRKNNNNNYVDIH